MTRRAQTPRIGSTGIRANRMAKGGRVASESRIRHFHGYIGDAGEELPEVDPCASPSYFPLVYMPDAASVTGDLLGNQYFALPDALGMPVTHPISGGGGHRMGGLFTGWNPYFVGQFTTGPGIAPGSSHSYQVNFPGYDTNRFNMNLHGATCDIYPNWNSASYLRTEGWVKENSSHPLDSFSIAFGWGTFTFNEEISVSIYLYQGQWTWYLSVGSNYYDERPFSGSLSNGQLIHFDIDLNLSDDSGVVQVEGDTWSFSLAGVFNRTYPERTAPYTPSVYTEVYTGTPLYTVTTFNTLLVDSWTIETDAPWETPA